METKTEQKSVAFFLIKPTHQFLVHPGLLDPLPNVLPTAFTNTMRNFIYQQDDDDDEEKEDAEDDMDDEE